VLLLCQSSLKSEIILADVRIQGSTHNGRFALDFLRFERADVGLLMEAPKLHLSDTAQALLQQWEESGPGDRVLLSDGRARISVVNGLPGERVFMELPKRQHVPATDWAG